MLTRQPVEGQGPAPASSSVWRWRGSDAASAVEVTDIEAASRHALSAQETLAACVARYPGVRFVLLMGAE